MMEGRGEVSLGFVCGGGGWFTDGLVIDRLVWLMMMKGVGDKAGKGA